MRTAVQKIINEHPVQVTNTSVSELLGFFVDDFSSSGSREPVPGLVQIDVVDDEQYELDLNRAIEESLRTAQKEAESIIDEQQREMQE